MYKPLKVTLMHTAGVGPSMKAMRLPKANKKNDPSFNDDLELAAKLVKAGPDHSKFARGCMVWLKVECQVGWLIEYVTYRHGVECLSSSSSMHMELRALEGERLAEEKQRDLPEKVYSRIEMISYQALRAMYRSRRNHRHPDWQIFCDFIETLPYFDKLIYPERRETNE